MKLEVSRMPLNANRWARRCPFRDNFFTASAVLVFLSCLMVHSARATPYLWVDQDAVLSKYEAIFVDSVSNDTQTRLEFDVTNILRQRLVSSLREQGFDVLDSQVTGKKVLTLKGQLTLYTAGSAVARWILPGSDPTQAVLRARFIDTESGETVADTVAGVWVGGGGLFSIGADKSVLETIATGVATALRERRDAEQQGR